MTGGVSQQSGKDGVGPEDHRWTKRWEESERVADRSGPSRGRTRGTGCGASDRPPGERGEMRPLRSDESQRRTGVIAVARGLVRDLAHRPAWTMLRRRSARVRGRAKVRVVGREPLDRRGEQDDPIYGPRRSSCQPASPCHHLTLKVHPGSGRKIIIATMRARPDCWGFRSAGVDLSSLVFALRAIVARSVHVLRNTPIMTGSLGRLGSNDHRRRQVVQLARAGCGMSEVVAILPSKRCPLVQMAAAQQGRNVELDGGRLTLRHLHQGLPRSVRT